MIKGIDYIGVAVGIMIFNDEGELFLAKRSQQAKNEKGCWEAPGRTVEMGETLKEAIRREMREKFGVEIEIEEQFPAADHLLPKEQQHWVATTFVGRIADGYLPQIDEPEKCDEIGWFPLFSLPQPLSEITKIDLKRYKEYTSN